MTKLNLGCGSTVIDGYEGGDIFPGKDVKHVVDLEKYPWPFEDSSISEIIAYNILEHIHETAKIMEEMYRILTPGGEIDILVPYYNSAQAFQDPTHKSFFTEHSMDYFTVDGETKVSSLNYYSNARFKINSIEF